MIQELTIQSFVSVSSELEHRTAGAIMPNTYTDLFIAKQDAIELRKATALVYQPKLGEDGNYRLQVNYSLSPYREDRPVKTEEKRTETVKVEPKARQVNEPVPTPVIEPPPPPITPPVGIFAGKEGLGATESSPQTVATPITAAPIVSAPNGSAAGLSLAATPPTPSSSATTGLIVNSVVK